MLLLPPLLLLLLPHAGILAIWLVTGSGALAILHHTVAYRNPRFEFSDNCGRGFVRRFP